MHDIIATYCTTSPNIHLVDVSLGILRRVKIFLHTLVADPESGRVEKTMVNPLHNMQLFSDLVEGCPGHLSSVVGINEILIPPVSMCRTSLAHCKTFTQSL